MAINKNMQWLLKSRPAGMISPDQFELTESEVPVLKEGEVLAKVLLLSFDPTQRAWMSMDTYIPAVNLGEPMRAGGIAQVIESRNSKFKPGDLVNSFCGWQEYVVFQPDNPKFVPVTRIPGHLDPKLILALSLTGLTAYFGMLEIGCPKRGETVLISGAAGATGSVAGQIAKLKGCKVVGIAGGEKKCKWLKEIAKFDFAIDYKNQEIAQELDRVCPEGVDVYFDNVGGPITDEVLLRINQKARVVLCGAISQYNQKVEEMYGLQNYLSLVINRGRAEGFIILDYLDRALEGLLKLTSWVESGNLIQEIDLQYGFENIPSTLLRIFNGDNVGKQILQLAEPPLPIRTNPAEQLIFSIMQKLSGLRG